MRKGNKKQIKGKEKNHRAYGMMTEKKHTKGVLLPVARDTKAPGTTFIDEGSDPCHQETAPGVWALIDDFQIASCDIIHWAARLRSIHV